MPPLQVSNPGGTNSTKEDPLKVFLHYLPAHFEDRDEDVSPCNLNLRRMENMGDDVWKKEARPAGCLGSVRPGGAQPEHRTRLSGLNGLGRRKERERTFRRMTSIQYKCSIHCCFCIQPLDSVKCFNICAILNYFKIIVYTGQKCTAL